jgi:SET domain-containing protein
MILVASNISKLTFTKGLISATDDNVHPPARIKPEFSK